MERLTTRCSGYAVMAWEHEEKHTTQEWIDMLTDRLAAYEDTGLEPEEIYEVRFLIAAQRDPQKLSRLSDLVLADQEGRLVVLPCKVGDTVLVKDRAGVPREMRLEAPDIRFVCTEEDNFCGATCNRKPDGFCAYRLRNDGSDIGKTVFLTREDAEAALAGKGGDG